MMPNDIDNHTRFPLGRILFVTSNFPRWAGDSTTPFILHLARDLQEIGWKIDVLAPHAKGTARCELLDGVSVERFRYLWPSSLETICYQGGALVNLRKNRANIMKLPALITAEWAAVARRLITRKYDVVHSHWILPQGFTCTLAARPLGIPHVITAHGSDIFALRNSVLTAFKRFALRRSDAVTVNSSAAEKSVTEIAPGIKNLHRIPMGVSSPPLTDASSSSDIRSKYRHGQGPLLVFVGRVVKEKGVEEFIRAVALLAHRVPDVSAIIVGDGQDRPSFEVLTKSLGLEGRVVFSGWVSPESVPAYLSAGDIFVGPSWMESQGLTFIEAMLARTAVIATRVGGIPDVVKHEESGLLVNKNAPEEIANAVERLVRDPMLGQRLRAAGHKLVETKFSRTAAAEAFSRLFTKIIYDKSRQ